MRKTNLSTWILLGTFALASFRLTAGGDESWMDDGKNSDWTVADKQLDLDMKDVRSEPKSKRKPWQLSLSAGGGYNSNVLLMGDGLPLPVSISNKGTGYGEFALDGSYEWRLSRQDRLVAGYSFLAQIYDNLHAADLIDHYWFADYAHSFDRNWIGTFRLSDEYQLAGGHSFSNQFVARPAISRKWFDWLISELHYSFAETEYFLPIATAVFDRDGDSHTVGTTQHFRIPDTEMEARLGYAHTWSSADGLDFDYKRHSLTVGFNTPLIWEVDADVYYTHNWDYYNNLNSLSPAGRLTKRRDDSDFFGIQLTRPINDVFTAYIRYNFNQNESNIIFYQYDQHIWTGGVIAHF